MTSTKSSHNGYITEFRTKQCPLFLERKCPHHRPYTCFNWHYANQRRRAPLVPQQTSDSHSSLKGTHQCHHDPHVEAKFAYSPFQYCSKYDENTGVCPDGDSCALMHKCVGDTERRFHPRFYKTSICPHTTDAQGHCSKYGVHCAYSHGLHDLRAPTLERDEHSLALLDLVAAQHSAQLEQTLAGLAGLTGVAAVAGLLEQLQLRAPDTSATGTAGESLLARRLRAGLEEQLALAAGGSRAPLAAAGEQQPRADDSLWNDMAYVLATYKTMPCPRPPRQCRQGFACPYYHPTPVGSSCSFASAAAMSAAAANAKDRRRSPLTYRYKSSSCPTVKRGDEWGDPSTCEAGDACAMCHTRSEQQFHPEIYKSTKCNDMLTCGYCPRGPFCAFSHMPNDAALARACIVASATYGLQPAAASPAPCANGAGDTGDMGNEGNVGNWGAASADASVAELTTQLPQSASSGALYNAADRRRSSGYESCLAPESNELEIGIWMPSQPQPQPQLTQLQREASDNCNYNVNNMSLSPESNQQYAPVAVGTMQPPPTAGHLSHMLHSGQQIVQQVHQSPLSPVNNMNMNMNMHYPATSHKPAMHQVHQQVQTSPPPALSKAQAQAQMAGRNASGNCSNPKLGNGSLLWPIEEASDAKPELPAGARAAAGRLRNCSGPPTFIYPPARDPPAAAAVQSSITAVELLEQLFPRRGSLDAAWTTQPLLSQVDCLRSALSHSSIGTSVASGGGSPTQQHSPTSSNGSVWSSGGSPGCRYTAQERTPHMQMQQGLPLPANSSPPLKDYLPLSPGAQTAAATAFAAAAGIDGSGCGAGTAARWGPIGGEMRGRHDSGVCVRHSPTELLGADLQPWSAQ